MHQSMQQVNLSLIALNRGKMILGCYTFMTVLCCEEQLHRCGETVYFASTLYVLYLVSVILSVTCPYLYSLKTKAWSRRLSTVYRTEVCANGNAFVQGLKVCGTFLVSTSKENCQQ